MFIDFDEIFNPTEYQRQDYINHINNIIRESVRKHGECCCNCKHLNNINCGHGWMYPRCSITREWIKEDIKCEHYKFQGFLEGKN